MQIYICMNVSMMYVCIPTDMYDCTYGSININTHPYVCTRTYTQTQTQHTHTYTTSMYKHTHIHNKYVYTYTSVYTHTHARTDADLYIHTHTQHNEFIASITELTCAPSEIPGIPGQHPQCLFQQALLPRSGVEIAAVLRRTNTRTRMYECQYDANL